MELVISIIVAIFVAVLISETYAWLPKISKLILHRAVRRLDPKDQERYLTEWNANLEDLPNTLVKLVHAISHYVAADRIRTEIVDAQWNSAYYKWRCIFKNHQLIMNAFQINQLKFLYANSRKVGVDRLNENIERMDELVTSISTKYLNIDFEYLSIEEKVRYHKELIAELHELKIITDWLKPHKSPNLEE